MTGPAKTIYQDLLDRNTRALIDGDAAVWVDGLTLPHRLTTCDGSVILETGDDAAVTFNDYRSALKKIGVVRMERTCEIARFSEPDRIAGYHTTAMFRETGEALPVYTTKWVLSACADGKWRSSKADSALSADSWGGMPYDRLSLFRRGDSRNDMHLRQEVQRYLDRIDTTLLHGDFDEWQRVFKLPIVLETPHGQTLLDTTERLRREFDLYTNAFRINRVTDYTRVVRTAEQIDENFMMTTYRAHLMSGPRYVVEPWNAALTMRREGGSWYITKLMGSVGPLYWRPMPYSGGPSVPGKPVDEAPQPEPTPKTGR